MGDLVNLSTTIQGVTLTQLRVINDPRGSVLHMLRADAPDFQSFGECYFSELLPNAIKAWKRHLRQTQNLAVPVGRVRFAIYDPRKSSPSEGMMDVVELGRPDSYMRLRIPPLVWYGFKGLGDSTSLVVNCPDVPHDPTESEVLEVDALTSEYSVRALRGGRAPR